MLRNSIFIDMKVYVLELKQKTTARIFHNFFCKILEQLLSRIIFFFGVGGAGTASEKKTRGRRAHSDPCFRFSLFPWQLFRSHETVFFFHKLLHLTEPFNLDYIIHFYKPKKDFYYQDFSVPKCHLSCN